MAISYPVVILTRDVSVKDIPLLRYMQAVKDRGDKSVHLLDTDEKRFEFVNNLVTDLKNEYGLCDYTTTKATNLKPSIFYTYLCQNNPIIPSFYLASYHPDSQRYSTIRRVTNKELSDLVEDRK